MGSCRTEAFPSCPSMTDHANVYRPLNTASTAKDLTNAFNVSRPTHVAVYPAFLKTVQDAILATDMAKAGRVPKVITILERQKGLPKAISPQNNFIFMRIFLI